MTPGAPVDYEGALEASVRKILKSLFSRYDRGVASREDLVVDGAHDIMDCFATYRRIQNAE